MTRPVIRKATADDAAELSILAESTFRATFAEANTEANLAQHCRAAYGEPIQRSEILSSEVRTILAECNESLVAYAQLRLSKAPSCVVGARAIEIQRLYVAQFWHGRGLAQALMSACLTESQAVQADVVWLGVWEHNPRAIAFYKKFGFVEVGEHIFQLGEDPQRDIIMVRFSEGSRAIT